MIEHAGLSRRRHAREDSSFQHVGYDSAEEGHRTTYSLEDEVKHLRQALQVLRAENDRLKNHVSLKKGHDEEALENYEARDSALASERKLKFWEALKDRAAWLIGLLVFQSASGLILARHEDLLARHPVTEWKSAPKNQ